MGKTLEEYITKMKTAPDEQYPGNEWDIVYQILDTHPEEFDEILKWIFTKHQGYVHPRVLAGNTYVSRNPHQGFNLIEQLIKSLDPDDRDTGVSVLEETGNIEKYILAKPLLDDKYPYLQFDGIRLLKSIIPKEVKVTLQRLLKHDQEWVIEKAQTELSEMD
jgi:hypothetical protein